MQVKKLVPLGVAAAISLVLFAGCSAASGPSGPVGSQETLVSDSGGERAQELSMSASSQSELSATERSELFSQKARELVGEHGAPAVKRSNSVAFIDGLAYVGTADFGRGECLVTCYRDASAPEPSGSYSESYGYELEVWRASSTSALERVYGGDPGASVSINVIDGKAYLVCMGTMENGEKTSESDQVYLLRSFTDDGSFDVTDRMVRAVGGRDPVTLDRLDDRYEVNGSEVSQEEWEMALQRRNAGASEAALITLNGGDSSSVEKTAGNTMDVLARLGVEAPAPSVPASESGYEDVLADGLYEGILSINGEATVYSSIPTVSAVSLEGRAFKVFGALDYYESGDSSGSHETLKSREWAFPVSGAVTYQLRGGQGERTAVSESEFVERIATTPGVLIGFNVVDGQADMVFLSV